MNTAKMSLYISSNSTDARGTVLIPGDMVSTAHDGVGIFVGELKTGKFMIGLNNGKYKTSIKNNILRLDNVVKNLESMKDKFIALRDANIKSKTIDKTQISFNISYTNDNILGIKGFGRVKDKIQFLKDHYDEFSDRLINISSSYTTYSTRIYFKESEPDILYFDKELTQKCELEKVSTIEKNQFTFYNQYKRGEFLGRTFDRTSLAFIKAHQNVIIEGFLEIKQKEH